MSTKSNQNGGLKDSSSHYLLRVLRDGTVAVKHGLAVLVEHHGVLGTLHETVRVGHVGKLLGNLLHLLLLLGENVERNIALDVGGAGILVVVEQGLGVLGDRGGRGGSAGLGGAGLGAIKEEKVAHLVGHDHGVHLGEQHENGEEDGEHNHEDGNGRDAVHDDGLKGGGRKVVGAVAVGGRVGRDDVGVVLV